MNEMLVSWLFAAAVAALLFGAYLLVGMAAFAVQSAARGGRDRRPTRGWPSRYFRWLTRPRVVGQGGLVRNALSSALATASDFALVALLVSGLGVSVPLATFVGCLLGGVVNFTVNRIWVYASDAPTVRQARRYLVVTSSSAVWNSVLVALLLLLPGLPYVAAWWLARAAVFAGWSFPLNRDYVFLRPLEVPDGGHSST